MKKRKLDELDTKILDWLSKDARVSNRMIARDLDVTEGTVRGRIKRLLDDKVAQIMTITGFWEGDSPTMVYLGIQTDSSNARKVAEKLAAMPDIRFVAIMLGRFNILAITVPKSHDDLLELVNKKISPLSGVRHVETNVSLGFVKYDYRWGRILGD